MHQFTALSIAILATSALAAPAPKQKSDKHIGHFAAAIQNHGTSAKLDPLAEMKHVFGKYDWTFDVSKFDTKILQPDHQKIDHPKLSMPGIAVPNGKPAGASEKQASSSVDVSVDLSLPDLLDGLNDILGGGSNEPETTTSTAVKTSKTKTKKVKSTATSTAFPEVTASSYVDPVPVTSSTSEPAYSAAPEISSSIAAEPVYSDTPEPVTSSAVSEPVTSSAVPEPTISSAAPEPVISSAAPEASSSIVTEPSSSIIPSPEPIASSPSTTETPIISSAPPEAPSSSSSVGTYTPSFAFEPTTSAVETSAAPATSSTVPTTFSSIIVAPSSTKQSTDGKVTATPEQNESEYLSPVSVGGQTLNLNFDTGSADFWVFSSSLSDSQRAGHAAFDPSKSSTFQNADGYTWSIAYGDGSSASGNVGFDVVAIGSATATRQAVGVATAVADKFAKDINNDGLVGLAFSNINTIKPQQQKTFFENIMPNLDLPLFTADLRQDTEVSTYEFGVIDASKYKGDIHYTPIDNTEGHWKFASTTYTIAGQSYTNANAAPAIADTGTSLLLVDQATVTAYYGAVTGATFNSQVGGYTYPCTASLPEFGMQIGSSGYTAVIPGAGMTYAPLGDGNCFGGLQSNGGGNYQILGDILFKQYFAIFNGAEKKLGVALKA